ncbi:hypothetical protein MSAN_01138900 [Mycena sanguinolenta]|uniref:Uncharacterized protein n=1 Tax=Mycena sanguinolenta TaxID=230812 RepID=A0A8H6YL85_9AGAR|nr:hypothetical protein MSAN_01138900 [Mycena sanguinolenta]
MPQMRTPPQPLIRVLVRRVACRRVQNRIVRRQITLPRVEATHTYRAIPARTGLYAHHPACEPPCSLVPTLRPLSAVPLRHGPAVRPSTLALRIATSVNPELARRVRYVVLDA